MKSSSALSRRFVMAIVLIISAMIVILSLAFHYILKTNILVIRQTLLQNNETTLIQKARRVTDMLKNVKGEKLAENITRLCSSDHDFLYVIVFSKTADENYFKVREKIPLTTAFAVNIDTNAVVQEDKDTNYLKKGLFGAIVDPQMRLTDGTYWQSVYTPLTVHQKTYVLEYFMSSAKTYAVLHEYSEEIARIKRFIMLLGLSLIACVFTAAFVFMHNFSLLITNLSKSMKKAASGHFDINLNTESDDELGELAHSFNGLIEELKAKEKNIHTLENRDPLSDIFRTGVQFLKDNRLDDAVRLFTAITLLKPDGFGSYFNLGVAFAKKRAYDSSLAMFERAHDLNPSDELTAAYIDKVKRLMTDYARTAPESTE